MSEKVVIPNEIMLAEVRNLLEEGREVIIMTKGSSMRPFIFGDEDSVLLKKHTDYNVGDIVLAEIMPGKWVLHRINARKEDKILLKGDGNLIGTERCTIDNIAGAVEKIIKPGREVDCTTEKFRKLSRKWVSRSVLDRRIRLGILNRIHRFFI